MTNATPSWAPAYERWRHGGWFVINLRCPNSAGCVCNNYPDRRWRIVCEASQTPFPSRDTAAPAERALALYQSRAAAIPNTSQNDV